MLTSLIDGYAEHSSPRRVVAQGLLVAGFGLPVADYGHVSASAVAACMDDAGVRMYTG